MGYGFLLLLLAVMGGGKPGPQPTPGPSPKPGPVPPYPLPRPYAPSSTTCFRTGQRYNAAILGTPEQAVAVLNYLGVPIGKVELLQADAAAKTPIWQESKGYAGAPSQKLKILQAVFRSLKLPAHANAPASSVDGIWGECSAVDTGIAAGMAETGAWTPPLSGLQTKKA